MISQLDRTNHHAHVSLRCRTCSLSEALRHSLIVNMRHQPCPDYR